ncbi:hypothetical protein [Azonexus sp.]|uniref:hypothetical protein n=1 Tax=Azonexus sp. TaxID=1872668 RepID=UPI0039E4028F
MTLCAFERHTKALIVDAKTPTAATFYQHFGFSELPGYPGRWLLPRAQFAA